MADIIAGRKATGKFFYQYGFGENLRSCIHKRLSKVWKWEILTMASADETEIS